MLNRQAPLYTLSVDEIMAFIHEQIQEVWQQKKKYRLKLEQEIDNDEHFSIAELTRFLRCSKDTIHTYKKKGMPFYRIGKKILFRKTEVIRFLRDIPRRRVSVIEA